jgi:hypothetical protein
MEKYLLQTDERLCREINLYGCNFMVLLFCNFIARGAVLTAEETMTLFTIAKEKGILRPNCFVNDNNALLALCGPVRYCDNTPAPFIRLEYSTNKKNFNHFILCYQGMIYNPDPTIKLLKCCSIRFYK